ncbi:MAG: PTS sugar transporter subunit IIA [Spirochaetaceae bacterium]|nr:PTS sugar transporter subunit IIA [Spirochaetaceae bacterium]
MRTWQSLNSNCIVINSVSKNKKEVIAEIAHIASKSPLLSNQSEEKINEKLQLREKISSTGLSKGIAFSHCGFTDMEDFVVGIIKTSTPIDFDAIDNQKSQLFIFIIGPDSKRNKHIQILSTIAKAVSVQATVNLLMKSDSPEMMMDVFESKIVLNENNKDTKEKSKLTLIIQKEEYFDDLLQIFSGEVVGSLVVYETESASRYLHRLPLFASFWGGLEDSFCRVITIVIDKVAVNSAIRKVKEIVPNIEEESGVFLTVTDINYAIGSIDF